jgi:hypothetical protein
LANIGQLQRLSDAAAPALTLDLGGFGLVDLAYTLRGATDRVVALTVPTRISAGIRGNLDLDTGADGLFEALRADRLGEWATANPSAVVPLHS